MKILVRTWLRPTKKGAYVYYLRWTGEDGKASHESNLE